MRAVGGFLLAVGIAIAGLWVVQLAAGQVPEVAEGRVDIWFHIVAELATAAVLMAAGLALLQRHRWGRTLGGVAVGALAYTTVNSPGYYAESGEWAVVGVFAVLAAVTIAAGSVLVRADRQDDHLDRVPTSS